MFTPFDRVKRLFRDIEYVPYSHLLLRLEGGRETYTLSTRSSWDLSLGAILEIKDEEFLVFVEKWWKDFFLPIMKDREGRIFFSEEDKMVCISFLGSKPSKKIPFPV